jgi:eukaryotic-like serine/threonine-protein kinase
MALAPGTKLGPYEIVAPLGAGGMGEVYRARDTRLDRSVAIKVLPSAFSADSERMRRFEQEARALSALNHPNLLAIYDIGSQDGIQYLVSELLEGESLRERLGEGALPWRKTVDYSVQMAKGLAAAHEKGIVHRDLKPENVFVSRDGRVKILDFGLAKLAADAGESAATLTGAGTQPGVVMGTIGYMSPEQVRGKPADARSDIFSFGVILYEMVAGRRAFQAESPVETLNAIIKIDPLENVAENKNISLGAERVIRRCIEKAPEERFQSASDLAFAIEAIGGSSSTAARAAIGGDSDPSPGRVKWARPVIAAVILFVGIAAGFLIARVGKDVHSGMENSWFEQLTFRAEPIFNARFAPDAQTVVFSSAPEGNIPQLYMHRPDFPAPIPMDLNDETLLSISSKGELAVLTNAKYVAQRMYRGTLAQLPVSGGAPRELLQDVREADWSPDGTKLAVVHEVGGKDRIEYPIGTVLYEASSGYLSDIRVSPLGDRIAFFEHQIRWDDRGSVDTVDLAGRVAVVSTGYQSLEGLAWAPDGKNIFFSGQVGSGMNEAIYEATLDQRQKAIYSAPDDAIILDVAKDGTILLIRSQYEQHVMAAADSKVERDMSWLDTSNHGVLSSDGKVILLSETSAVADANYALILRKTDGSPVVKLGEGVAQGISPDKQWALSMVPSDPMRLVLYPVGAGEPRKLDTGNVQSYDSAAFFPDGKRVLLCGSEAAKPIRCYVQEIAGGQPRAVTPPGVAHGLVSPDGDSLVAQDADGTYSIYSIASGSAKPLPGIAADEDVSGWSADGRSLFVYRDTDVPARVERFNISTGKRVFFKEISPPSRAGALQIRYVGITADEKSYTYSYTRELCRLSIVKKSK